MAHGKAKLTVPGRLSLVQRTESEGWPAATAAEAQGVSRATAYKWPHRWRSEGLAGLADRSSRPHRSPGRTTPEEEAAIVAPCVNCLFAIDPTPCHIYGVRSAGLWCRSARPVRAPASGGRRTSQDVIGHGRDGNDFMSDEIDLERVEPRGDGSWPRVGHSAGDDLRFAEGGTFGEELCCGGGSCRPPQRPRSGSNP